MSVRPAKTQISLGIRPVWSESSLCAQWAAKDPSFLHADSQDSDQPGAQADLSVRWAHSTFLVLSCRGLKYLKWGVCFFFQIIYVARNPRDVLVSYYKLQRWFKFETRTFEKFYEDFMSGMDSKFTCTLWRWSPNLRQENKTRGPWATMLTWVNSYKSLIQHFRLSVAMATNRNEEFVQLLYAWWRTTQQTFIKKGSVKIPAVR